MHATRRRDSREVPSVQEGLSQWVPLKVTFNPTFLTGSITDAKTFADPNSWISLEEESARRRKKLSMGYSRLLKSFNFELIAFCHHTWQDTCTTWVLIKGFMLDLCRCLTMTRAASWTSWSTWWRCSRRSSSRRRRSSRGSSGCTTRSRKFSIPCHLKNQSN